MNADSGPAGTGLRWLLLLLALALFAPSAFAQTGVSFKLEGCRNTGSITLPNASGDYVCPDAAYTSGNLMGWNELDLVPHRITMSAGNSAPSTQTYSVSIDADNCRYAAGTGFICADGESGKPGYDFMSAPVLNTALSSATGCSLDAIGAQVAITGTAGTDVAIARELTITQGANTECVYDYYERLALGASLLSGSSLHSSLLTASGEKDVPLPVNQLAPQGLRKTMSASASQTVSWDLEKTGEPTTLNFGDVCAADAPTSKEASITVTWTKNAATPGNVSVTTHVYAKNPSARTITVNVTDRIYEGLVQDTLLDTLSTPAAGVNVGAGQEIQVLTHTASLDPAAGGVGDWLNDVATATYTDNATGIPIPGDETASANAQIAAGTTYNNTADVSDSESITGNGLSFSVEAPAVGDFLDDYDGSATTGPVDWNALAQDSSGFVTFSKTINLADKTVMTGTLSDTAYLDTSSQHLSSPVSISIGSSATVALTVSKTIPSDYLNETGDTLKVFFHIAGTTASNFSDDFSLTFENGGVTTLSKAYTGLTPDSYTVTEDVASAEYCDAQDTCTNSTFLAPDATSKTKDLIPDQNGSMVGRCSGTAAFTNTVVEEPLVFAQVQKVTDPELPNTDADYLWDFALSGPTSCEAATAGAGAGYVYFMDSLDANCALADGDYTVSETLKPGWRQDSATPNDGVDTMTCAFHVNVILDVATGQTPKSCTFHNTKYGRANVVKTAAGAALTGTDAFTFQLRSGASASADGTILESLDATAANSGNVEFTTYLTPGSHYQLCEIVMPGWLTSLANTFIPPSGSIDGSVCTDFTVGAGQTMTFTVDNTPPPGGLARTIGFWKNWASCHQSNGKQAPVLDDTLEAATPPGIQVGNFYLTTGECANAVALLSKSSMSSGNNMASDPLYRLAAQLIGAELNVVAGAATCPAVSTAIASANTLLSAYNFNGSTYSLLNKPKTPAQKAAAQTADSLANTLDMYNNNLLCF